MPFKTYVKIDGIEGDSTDRGHKGEIDVVSFGWGVKASGTGGGGGGSGSGKATASDFTFLMEAGIATPDLAVACCTGEHLRSVVCTSEDTSSVRRGRNAYLQIKMTDCIVSSYQTGGSVGSTATDQVSLSFAKIEMEYSDERGKKHASFCDFETNTGGS